ncbi:MAG: hypothetical protein LIO70_03650 [Clostridiales bacterium]|nr:hypothetical protein [Clostridiales bacterium]
MKRAYELELDGVTYRLRLTVGGQRRLIKKYKGELPLQICLTAMQDIDRLCAVLEEALHWTNSGNPDISGEDFYELLVDEGYAGVSGIGGQVVCIMAESGMLTAGQRNALLAGLDESLEQAFANLTAAEADTEEARPTDA